MPTDDGRQDVSSEGVGDSAADGKTTSVVTMDGTGDQGDDPDGEESLGNPKSFALGYMHGLSTLWDRLDKSVRDQYQLLYDHCANHYDEVVNWEESGDGDPPTPAPFVK